ncbi:MAG: FAD-binding oxidoreductase, partial [Rhodobacteraceae bacterium]|nr:FAD-binding oxidoreductase [Paracoccaceae bacterium]
AAAGPAAARVMGFLGEEIPVEPRKRTVFVVDAPNSRHPEAPLIVDGQGYYARPERDCWITGAIPEDDGAADPDDFDPDLDLFEELIWPKLYNRMPGFDQAKVLRAWAGHYAYNRFDQNALLGLFPGYENFYVMNGFSGHGLQQAPAVGRGIAELVLTGGYQTLDLSDLDVSRIFEGRPLRELAIV